MILPVRSVVSTDVELLYNFESFHSRSNVDATPTPTPTPQPRISLQTPLQHEPFREHASISITNDVTRAISLPLNTIFRQRRQSQPLKALGMVDLIFAVDGSENMSQQNFLDALRLASRITDSVPFGPDNFRCVLYLTPAYRHLYFDSTIFSYVSLQSC